jgi:hypothetical protein
VRGGMVGAGGAVAGGGAAVLGGGATGAAVTGAGARVAAGDAVAGWVVVGGASVPATVGVGVGGTAVAAGVGLGAEHARPAAISRVASASTIFTGSQRCSRDTGAWNMTISTSIDPRAARARRRRWRRWGYGAGDPAANVDRVADALNRFTSNALSFGGRARKTWGLRDVTTDAASRPSSRPRIVRLRRSSLDLAHGRSASGLPTGALAEARAPATATRIRSSAARSAPREVSGDRALDPPDLLRADVGRRSHCGSFSRPWASPTGPSRTR